MHTCRDRQRPHGFRFSSADYLLATNKKLANKSIKGEMMETYVERQRS